MLDLLAISVLTVSTLDFYPQNKKMEATVTCYTSEVGQTDSSPSITASGRKLSPGDNVVANNCLPFGSIIMIDDILYTVDDRKAKRYSCKWVDIWFGETEERKQSCLKFGRQEKMIYILDYGNRNRTSQKLH